MIKLESYTIVKVLTPISYGTPYVNKHNIVHKISAILTHFQDVIVQ